MLPADPWMAIGGRRAAPLSLSGAFAPCCPFGCEPPGAFAPASCRRASRACRPAGSPGPRPPGAPIPTGHGWGHEHIRRPHFVRLGVAHRGVAVVGARLYPLHEGHHATGARRLETTALTSTPRCRGFLFNIDKCRGKQYDHSPHMRGGQDPTEAIAGRISGSSSLIGDVCLWELFEPRMGAGWAEKPIHTFVEVSSSDTRFGLAARPGRPPRWTQVGLQRSCPNGHAQTQLALPHALAQRWAWRTLATSGCRWLILGTFGRCPARP